MNNVAVVLSHKRSQLLLDRKLTLAWVRHLKIPTYLAVRESEAEEYFYVAKAYDVTLLPMPDEQVQDSGLTRDYLVDYFHMKGAEKLSLLDDDLIFSYRESFETKQLPKLPYEDTQKAFNELFSIVDRETIHAGFRNRAFAQNCENGIDYYKRILWSHTLYLPEVVAQGFKFAWEGRLMADFHFQLSVISAGYRTATLNTFICDDAVGPYKNGGGCNTYRTCELRTFAARKLQEKFPEAVTLRDKETPDGWCEDVTVRFGNARTK